MISKGIDAMIRESSRGMDGADAANFDAAVRARLHELLDSGVVASITKNHIRAACSQESANGK
jgi:hypothetical protein